MQSIGINKGERVTVDKWVDEFEVTNILPYGDYYRVSGTSKNGYFSRLLDPRYVKVVKNGSEVSLQDPVIAHKQRSLGLSSIEPGQIIDIRDRVWRVDSYNPNDKLIRISNVTGVESRHQLYAPVEILRPAVHPPPNVHFVGNPGFQRLLLQALKLDLMHGTAALMGLQRSRVVPMSYQLVPVLMALELPKARLLLADDVGLGKTIEAGLIVSELLSRRLADRVLFVTPANLREQWQDILKRFFHIDAKIISSRHLRQLERELLVGGDPWGHYPFLITSIDYAKQGHVLQRIKQYPWDIVVMDEVHNAAKPHQNVASSNIVMQRYAFAREIAVCAKHLLLLSATPHNGYRDTFASLLEMLNPDIVSGEVPDVRINRDIAKKHICQRRRDDVKGWLAKQNLGDDPFPERDNKEEFVGLSSELREVIDSVNDFSEHILQSVVSESLVTKRVARWTILHFHKRALSSPYAVKCSIQNRIKKIDEELAVDQSSRKIGLSEDDARRNTFDIPLDLPEEEVDLRTDRVLFGTRQAFENEKKLLKAALAKCERVTPSKDAKLYYLLRNAIPDAVRRAKDRKPKIIIFTRYKDTLDYLVQNIEREVGNSLVLRGMDVYSIHGQMSNSNRREEFESFKQSDRAILVTTDCMAEGIDLQYSANQLIHYELPWNPNRLEQRNGRIDRFGQPKETVYIRALIMEDTLEAAILENLILKANRIREDFGFAPPFFGDDLAVLDAIADYRLVARYGPQKTLYEYADTPMNRARRQAEELEIVNKFYDHDTIKMMEEDSFYGQTGVDLNEVTRKMTETEAAFGGRDALHRFVKAAVANLGCSLEDTDDEYVYKLSLSEELAESFEVEADLRVTFNQRRGVADPSIYVVDLGSSVLTGLLDRVLAMSYQPDNKHYGRTAAVGSRAVTRVTAVVHVRMRYLVNSDPRSIVEDIVPIGFTPFGGEVLPDEKVEALVGSEYLSHGRGRDEIVDDLEETIMHPKLLPLIEEAAKQGCMKLIEERREIKERLELDGLHKGLEGFDDVSVASQDILTVTLFYPYFGGES